MQVPPSASSSQLNFDADQGATPVSGAMQGGPVPSLAVCNVSKAFGDVRANEHISFQVAAGSVHAIVGENGAGKTTLMRIIYGLYSPDAGHVELNGEQVFFSSPRDALARGIGMVHQHSLLVDSLTVAENVLLAIPGLGRPPRQQTIARLQELSEANHLHLNPKTLVSDLSVGARQRAEILSALFHGARLLILDEPTTVLTPQEVDQLFEVVRRLREGGATIMVVTHKLREVMAISDRITVLRGGKVVDTVPTSTTDEHSLVRMMVGRDVPLRVSDAGQERTLASLEPLLEVDELTVQDGAGVTRVRSASFSVYPGEIVAITGVEGNGQMELVEAIVGLGPITSGELTFADKRITRWSLSKRRRAGLAYIPESRLTEGIDSAISVRDNLILGHHRQRPYYWFGVRNLQATRRFAWKLVEDFHISAPSIESDAATLSGGNLQKVVVAREVVRSPRLLIAAQPTQGVDVAASHLIRSTLLRLRDQGMAILLVSSDLSEVCDLADRAIVLYNGRVFGELQREELSEEAIGVFAMGLGA
jgi:general nucleoside transport system ATP-binding protein